MRGMREYYDGKVILIIGATSGMGFELVKKLSEFNVNLILTGRSIDSLKDKYDSCDNTCLMELDIRHTLEIEKMFEALSVRYETIDVLINLAGYDIFKGFDKISCSDIINTSRTNFEGAVLLTHYAIKILFKDSAGIIVMVNGFVSGKLSLPFFSIDSASRAAIANFFRSLRRELKNSALKFILFSPSGTSTEAERKRSEIWKLNKLVLLSPEFVVKKLLKGIVKGKKEICVAGFDERVLAFLDNYFPVIADIVFYNSFVSKTGKIFKKSQR